MNYAVVLDLIIKYAQYIPILIDAGASVINLSERLIDLATGAKDGTLTDEQIAEHRAALDEMIADFNAELPPE